MGGSEEPSIEFAGKDGHGDPIWAKKEMAAHRVESGERLTAELWVEFGGLRCSEERTRARRSELATVSSLRARFWREVR